MSAPRVKRNSELIRISDFRRELSFREKKVAEIKREKMKILADIKPVPKYMITVDMSHARGNLDAVRMCLRELEWKEFPFGRKEQHCDIHWQSTSFEQNPDLYGGLVNKFPGMFWICGKNNLFRVLDQMRLLYPEEYDFYPRTWYLPDEFHQLAHDIKKINDKRKGPKATFIIKPDSGSQGEGIYLIRDVTDFITDKFNPGRMHVCQEYLADVFLIDKFKFDLRVYTVLKSADPLEFYICKEGLARFSTLPYENPTNKNIHEAFMHLTNYSLNKKSATFNRSEREDEGSKRTLTSVFNRLKRMGHNTDKLWKKIEHMVVKTMIAILPDLKIELQNALPANKPGPSCFQILGFDILLMYDLSPMLLEINSSPSLRIDGEIEVAPGVPESIPSPKDEEVKIPLIRDTLLLVAPRKKVKYLERQKRRRRRHEQKRQKHEEETKIHAQEEEKHGPAQIERDGVIHVETRHPRSSIVIIRSSQDDLPKRMSKESSFVIPESLNRIGRRSQDNENDFNPSMIENLNLEYGERRNYEDHLEKMEEGFTEHENDTGVSRIKSSHENSKMLSTFVSGEGNYVRSDESKREQNTNNNNNNSFIHPENNSDEDKMDDSEHSGDESELNLDSYESCLKQLYPSPYADRFEKLRLYEKLAEVFTICLGVRATQRLGPTGFRTFSRKCRLNKKGLTNATIDILFIDMQRKWEHVNPERTTGLGFRGFLDACHEIAKRKFQNGSVLQTMQDFIDYCLENLEEEQMFQSRSNPRLLPRRARPHGYPQLGPMVTHLQSPVSEDMSGILLDSRMQSGKYMKPSSTEDVDLFLRRHNRLDAIKVKRSRSRTKDPDER
ncbi:tubulin polyglutamylase TTLL11-like [Dreissena polymorpha]|uniref:tubulin polyglutamylase TTLL11-like n=1 Tax=Dreissena polymorpha TaxID=45954 RepID=UPI0022654376|nr:tubulin polyglutamylase TTLL11-like [Dreissena polymorpha]